MLEFHKKDKNRRDITARITTRGQDVDLKLYAEVEKRFLFFFKRIKLVEVYRDNTWIGLTEDWLHQDYVKWVDDKMASLNRKIVNQEKRDLMAEKIKRGKV
jgi:hypothetical protein